MKYTNPRNLKQRTILMRQNPSKLTLNAWVFVLRVRSGLSNHPSMELLKFGDRMSFDCN